MTMTAFTGMLKSQPLAETVMVIVTSHSPVISRPICKLNKPIHLISAVINSAAKIRRFALSLQSQEIVIFDKTHHRKTRKRATFRARNHPMGTASLKTTFRPILNTPCRPVTTFQSAYFRRLKWSW